MKLKNTVASLLTAATIACGSPAPSTSEGNSSQPSITQEEPLEHLVKTTNSQGETTLRLYGEDVPVQVTDENENPIKGMKAHVVGSPTEGTIVAIDPKGKHYPSRAYFTTTQTQNLENNLEQQQQPLIGTIALIATAVVAGYKIIKTVSGALENLSNIERGDLLERGEQTNKYCMSISQMRNDYFEVIPGLILLAAEEAGLPTEEVKVAARTTLADIFEEHIVTKYGQHAGYEIEVPNTSMSVCGGEYNGVLCDLSDNQLSEILNPDLPYWKINGSCSPVGDSSSEECTPQGEKCSGNAVVSYDSCGNEEMVSSCTVDQYCDTGVCVDKADEVEVNGFTDMGNGTVRQDENGLLWQKRSPNERFTYDEAVEYCAGLDLAGKGWRVPSGDELVGLCEADVFCKEAGQSLFTGVCGSESEDSYWSSKDMRFNEMGTMEFNSSTCNGVALHRDELLNIRCIKP